MEKYILVGKGGSGKDYVASIMEKIGFKVARSVTTRRKRECNTTADSRAENRYNFVTNREFEELVREGKMFEFKLHQGIHHYGTTVKEWNSSHVHILSPKGVNELSERGDLENCTVIYLDRIPSGRGVRRPDEARQRNDYEDFKNFTAYDYAYRNTEINKKLLYLTIDRIKAGLNSDEGTF